jgi:SAM-dependent methyltransferase
MYVSELNGWDMIRCVRCHLVYTRDIPCGEQLDKVYENAYQVGGMYQMHLNELENIVSSDRCPQGFYRNYLFLRRYKPKAGDKLLEIGCGIGSFLLAAKREGWMVQGIDISAEAVRVSCHVHGLPVYQGTLEETDFIPSSYKAIVCWEVLEHLPSPRQLLLRVRNLLREDGIFVCSVPNSSERVPHFVRTRGPASLPPVHLNFWTIESFRQFANVNGFQPLQLFFKRSLMSMAGAWDHPARLMLNQLGTLINFREGDTIYAVLARNDSGQSHK